MSPRSTFLEADLAGYVEDHSTGPDEVQRELIAATVALGHVAVMQIGASQGSFMTLLTTVLQPRFAVEVGTFTGYSALSIAKALPAGGQLLCCDVSEEWTAIAHEHWERAGVSERIDLRIGPALNTLRTLPGDRAVDMAFIDADKESYIDYYEELVPRLTPQGVILVDNTLWSARVTQSDNTDRDTEAIRAFNTHAVNDERVIVSLLPVGDGLTVISRRPD